MRLLTAMGATLHFPSKKIFEPYAEASWRLGEARYFFDCGVEKISPLQKYTHFSDSFIDVYIQIIPVCVRHSFSLQFEGAGIGDKAVRLAEDGRKTVLWKIGVILEGFQKRIVLEFGPLKGVDDLEHDGRCAVGKAQIQTQVASPFEVLRSP